MSIQKQLDTLQNLLLSIGGIVKILNYQQFRGHSEELQHIENLLGEGLGEVQVLKKELSCVNILSIVAPGQE